MKLNKTMWCFMTQEIYDFINKYQSLNQYCSLDYITLNIDVTESGDHAKWTIWLKDEELTGVGSYEQIDAGIKESLLVFLGTL